MSASELRGSSALVTGATGLVGRALVRLLAQQGVNVRTLERGDNSVVGGGTIRVPSYAPRVVRDALKDLRTDYVFHLGAYGVKPQESDAVEMIDGNAGVTAAVLGALAPSAPRAFVFAGSSAQYAPVQSPLKLHEDDRQQPVSTYGAAKVGAEHMARVLANALGIPFVSLRLFGIYGPGEAPHRLIPKLARALTEGRQPDLTAGEQARDWVYVEDAAKALVAAATAPNLAHDAYNVCSGVAVSVRDVARLVGRALNGGCDAGDERLGLGRRPYRATEPMWIVGDPSRFAAATNWRAATALEDGVRRTVEWAVSGLKTANGVKAG